MSTTDLWREAAAESMEHAGCWPLWEQMTEEQKDAIGANLLRWADSFSEHSPQGQGCISDPRDTEIEKLEKTIRERDVESERREWVYQQHIAAGRQVHVGIRHGQVDVERKR